MHENAYNIKSNETILCLRSHEIDAASESFIQMEPFISVLDKKYHVSVVLNKRRADAWELKR